MNKIIALIEELCPEGVPISHIWELTIWDKKFNAVDNFKQPDVRNYKYFLASDLKALQTEKGDVKLLTTNKSDLWTHEDLAKPFVSEAEIIAIPWGGNPQIQYYKGKFLTADNRIAVAKNSDELNTKYLYYFLVEKLDLVVKLYKGAGIKHPSMDLFLDIRVPVPPKEIQDEIVKVLDTFSDLEGELEKELKARKKQYVHFRHELLNSQPKFKKKYTLESICTLITSGGTPPTDKQDEYYGGDIPWVRTTDVSDIGILDTPVKITPEGLKNSSAKMIPSKSVIIAMIGATVGKVAFTEIPVSTNQNCCNLVVDSNVANYKYVFHWLLNNTQMLIDLAPGAVPILNAGVIRNITIELPDLKRQKVIADHLDKFFDLFSNEEFGLPAEIRSRKQQYEYYREELLTFKELEPA